MIKKYSMIIILLLAALLRLWHLGSYPALNADEAAIGYNVYSLIHTGQDEHGRPWPIHFQSFNDYKPGGYFYIVLPFVYFFGLNEFSVRFPGAMLGVLTVLAIYFLIKELGKSLHTNYELLATVASFLLAISPCHIHFSRGGWEVNAATCFIVLGLYFFIKALKDKNYFALSILAFVASLYTYHAARIIVPLLGLSLLVIYRKTLFLKENVKLFAGSVVLALVLLVPLVHDFMGQAGQARAAGVSIFADRGYIDRINETRGRYENANSLYVRLLHNQPKEIVVEFAKNYLDHFWGEFLFVSGDDIQRNKVPEFGQLYLWQFPFLIIAAVTLTRRKKLAGWGIILIWLVIAPIPAALTFQSPHALRAQSMIIPLTILSAYGLGILLEYLNKNFNRKILLAACYILLSTIIVWDFSRYLHEYYVHMAKAYPYSSQYGVKELVGYISNGDFDKVVITTRYDQPYILFLFYSKFDPEKFQQKHVLSGRDKYGFSTVPEFDKYIFKSVDFETDKLVYPGALIVGTDEDIPNEANIIKNVYGSNGFLYFQAVAN